MLAAHLAQYPLYLNVDLNNYAVYAAPSSSKLASAVPHSDNMTPQQRKVERACDHCRRRKTKCDGMKMPDHVCSNCLQSFKHCTYLEASQPRGPPKAYVSNLEDRMEYLEALLEKVKPGVDFSSELGPPIVRDSWKHNEGSPVPAHSGRPHARSTAPHPLSSSHMASQHLSLSQPRALSHSRSIHFRPNHHSEKLPTLSHAQSYLLSMSMDVCLKPRSPTSLRKGPSNLSRRPPEEDARSSDGGCSSENESGVISPSGQFVPLTLGRFESTGDEHLHDSQLRYHGLSSMFGDIAITRKLKQEHYRHFGANYPSICKHENKKGTLRRPEFWTTPPWELAWEGLQGHSYSLLPIVLAQFPPPDLALILIKLYFANSNPCFPLLHQPTFERQWAERLYAQDIWFSAVCLAVFAVASRWCDDPRVLAESLGTPGVDTGGVNGYKAGWGYFNACLVVHRTRRSVIHQTCLFEVQTIALISMFLRGSQFAAVGWYMSSVGLRKLQDLGAHRSKLYGERPTLQGELWKRVFWVLVTFDRTTSVCLGRPPCVFEEDTDIELPLEVDDEYWHDNPNRPFCQPTGKPSLVTGFNLMIKLMQIFAVVLRTLYAPNRRKVLIGARIKRWDEEVVRHVNTAMKEWMDSVPEHLRWTPTMTDDVFAEQAATNYSLYYMLRILLYRPFTRFQSLPPSSSSSIGSELPSRAMAMMQCVDAARSCVPIVDLQTRRGSTNAPALIQSSNLCAAMLLARVWDLKAIDQRQMTNARAEDLEPVRREIDELMKDVRIMIIALERATARWEIAAYLLKDLKMPLPSQETAASENKPSIRSPSSDGQASHPSSTLHTPPSTSPQPLPTEHSSWMWESSGEGDSTHDSSSTHDHSFVSTPMYDSVPLTHLWQDARESGTEDWYACTHPDANDDQHMLYPRTGDCGVLSLGVNNSDPTAASSSSSSLSSGAAFVPEDFIPLDTWVINGGGTECYANEWTDCRGRVCVGNIDPARANVYPNPHAVLADGAPVVYHRC